MDDFTRIKKIVIKEKFHSLYRQLKQILLVSSKAMLTHSPLSRKNVVYLEVSPKPTLCF